MIAPHVINIPLREDASSSQGSQLPPEVPITQTPAIETTVQAMQDQLVSNATEEELETTKEEFGAIIENQFYQNWLEDHCIDKEVRVPPIPISKLKINPHNPHFGRSMRTFAREFYP